MDFTFLSNLKSEIKSFNTIYQKKNLFQLVSAERTMYTEINQRKGQNLGGSAERPIFKMDQFWDIS